MELASKYSKLEMEHLISEPKISLTPAEFLAVWKEEQKLKGYEDGARRRLNDDDDLREVYDSMEEVHKASGNRFVKACRAADLKCSNERAKKLVQLWGAENENNSTA